MRAGTLLDIVEELDGMIPEEAEAAAGAPLHQTPAAYGPLLSGDV